MLKLFRNPINHIGQKVLYWPDGCTDEPSVCIIRKVIIERNVMDKDLAFEGSKFDMASASVSSQGKLAWGKTRILKVLLQEIGNGIIFALPEHIYSNWTDWRESVRDQFQKVTADPTAVLDAFRTFEAARSDLERMFSRGRERTNPEAVDHMNVRFCEKFAELQRRMSVYRHRTYAQDLWDRLECKRIRQENSKRIRHVWNNTGKR